MYKIILCFFILSFSTFGQTENSFKNINTFRATVTETTNLNNHKRSTKYQVLGSLPSKLLKIIIAPNLNRGEIYLYNGTHKTIYYPILNQIITKKINSEENYTLKFIRDLKNYVRNINFKVIKQKNKITEIIYKDGTVIKFLSFYRINKIDFPAHVVIFDKNIKISDLVIKNVQLNVRVTRDDFLLNKVITKIRKTM